LLLFCHTPYMGNCRDDEYRPDRAGDARDCLDTIKDEGQLMHVWLKRLKRALVATRESVREVGFRISARFPRYSFIGSAFAREHSAVSIGIAEHYRRVRGGSEQFSLRRRL